MSSETVAKSDDLLKLASEIVAAYVSNNSVSATDVPGMIKNVHDTLLGLSGKMGEPASDQKPAVNIKKSVTPDYVVCLEDGKKLKMLKRYLRSRYGMSPDEYRTKWGLPADYPMVAPNYAAKRSAFAKQIGLGHASPRRTKRR